MLKKYTPKKIGIFLMGCAALILVAVIFLESSDSSNVGGSPSSEEQSTLPITEKYMGVGNGRYTLTDQQWLVFAWPDGHCVRADPPFPVRTKANDWADTFAFLSRKGRQVIEVRTLSLGESWKDFQCK